MGAGARSGRSRHRADQPGPVGTIVITSPAEARYTEFTLSLLRGGTVNTMVNWTRSADICRNLNEGIRGMQGDWVWILGDDHVWEADLLPRLIAHGKDIVVPLVLKRSAPFWPVAYTDWDEGEQAWSVLGPRKGMGLVEVEAAGNAGMFVSKRALDAIGDPWFELWRAGPKTDQIGEDIEFCRKAREAGFKIYCDTDAVMGHLTPVAIWPRWTQDGERAVGFRIDDFEVVVQIEQSQ